MVSYAPAIHLDAQTPGEFGQRGTVVVEHGAGRRQRRHEHEPHHRGRRLAGCSTPSRGATQAEYEHAALEGNVLGKQTEGARRRTFRYLKELYLLRPDACSFERSATSGTTIRSPAAAGGPLCARAIRCLPSEQRGDHRIRARRRPDLARPRRGRRRALPDELQREHAREDRPEHLLLVGADRAPRGGEPATTKVRTRATAARRTSRTRCCSATSKASAGEALFETLWAQVLDQPTSHLVRPRVRRVAARPARVPPRRRRGRGRASTSCFVRSRESSL